MEAGLERSSFVEYEEIIFCNLWKAVKFHCYRLFCVCSETVFCFYSICNCKSFI